MREQNHISQFIEFKAGDRVKKNVFKGKHFNIVVICLDSGCEISPHDEPYDVFFYVVSGSGVFTAGKQQRDAEPGSMIFAPAGIRGIKCAEQLTILGIQEPH